MIELIEKSDIFQMAKPNEAIVIPASGTVNKNGCVRMNSGVAKTAKAFYPKLDSKIGKYLKNYGNRCFMLGKQEDGVIVLSFPTKHEAKDVADLNLIEKSCKQLVSICDKWNIKTCLVPKVGCGSGHLDYQKDVRPILLRYFDNRFIVFAEN